MSRLALMGAGPSASTAAFDPATIAGMQLWLKADAGLLDTSDAAVTVDGTAVKTWQDQSGNGRNATQGTGAKQPLYKASWSNGKPALQFAAASAQIMGGSIPSGGTTSTVFIACEKTANVDSEPFWSAHEVMDLSGFIFGIYQGAPIGTSYLSTFSPTILTGIFSGSTTSSFRRDGAVIQTGNAGNAAQLSTYKVGGHNTITTRYLTGYIAEVIVYASALSTTDAAQVEAYLKARYGTP